MDTSSAATPLDEKVIEGKWQRNAAGRVVTVYCDCGYTVFCRGRVHAKIVIPGDGTALCRSCRRMVRVPVRFDG